MPLRSLILSFGFSVVNFMLQGHRAPGSKIQIERYIQCFFMMIPSEVSEFILTGSIGGKCTLLNA